MCNVRVTFDGIKPNTHTPLYRPISLCIYNLRIEKGNWQRQEPKYVAKKKWLINLQDLYKQHTCIYSSETYTHTKKKTTIYI